MPGDLATEFCKSLLRQPKTQLAGLGARDSLRLEAGLCLYGQDIDATTSPIEAGLAWTVGKRRRAEANFPGAPRILSELAEGPTRRRIGILPKSKSIPRAHMAIMNNDGLTVGEVTSGAFGPSIGGPIAMGYVDAAALDRSSELHIEGRRGPIAIDRVKMPFVQANTVSRPT